MNAKKHPDYIEKKVRLGEEELVLYSLDGQTWTSRPDELEVIKERRETGKVTMEKKGPAAKPTMRRMLPKRSNSNSANKEGEDGIISTVSGRRLPALIPGASGISSRKGAKKSKQIDKEEPAMTPEPKDVGNEKDEAIANSSEQRMEPLNSEQPLAEEIHYNEVKLKTKISAKSKGGASRKGAASAVRGAKKGAVAKSTSKKASTPKAKSPKSKKETSGKSSTKKPSTKSASVKKASRSSTAKKKTASKAKSKPSVRSKKPVTAQKKTAKKVVSKKSSVKKKPAKKK
jgi:hypothetical protein